MLFAACMGVGFSACYDDKADIMFYSGEQLIDQIGTCTNLISHVTLYLNGSARSNVGIAYGKGGYQAVSSNVKVVTVDIQNDRLILTAGGEKGNAVVTVTDEKGNQAQLSVECGIGVYTYRCVQAEAVPVSGTMEVLTDLKPAVAEALADYAPIKKDGSWILVPDERGAEQEQGNLQVYTEASAQMVKGTYVRNIEEEEQPAFFTPYVYRFSYAGETHEFRVSAHGVAGRSLGIVPIYFMEDVTERFQTASSATELPEGAKVYYIVKVIYRGLALQD